LALTIRRAITQPKEVLVQEIGFKNFVGDGLTENRKPVPPVAAKGPEGLIILLAI